MQKRGYHDFSFKIFCLTVPKNFVGEHFGVSENFGYRKILCIREGGIRFLRRIFLSHSADKIRRRTLLCFERILVWITFKILWIRGGITILRRQVFVSLYQNISLENTSVSQKNSFIENFHA